MADLFEKASRLKLRFASQKGELSVEQLWELNLPQLNTIAVSLNKEVKNDNVSFIDPAEGPDTMLQLRFDIVKYIIKTRLEERDSAEKARATREHNQKIFGIIASKKDRQLESMSVEELEALITK